MPKAKSAAAGLLLAFVAATCLAQEQYPKPLVHTPTDHPAARILLLSVDGLHAFDLANWIASRPQSALAQLSRRGVTYTNAHTPAADPVAGLLALTTGGTPISTGIITNDGYDRNLSPVGSACQQTGAELALNTGSDPSKPIALDGGNGCRPLAPHDLIRVNTMFEVARERVGPTAWAGEDAITTDLLRGPSGKGLNTACEHAVNDRARVDALIGWIDGAVPALFGMSFTGVAESQRRDGYLDALGTPSAGLTKALLTLDESIGRIVQELKAKRLFDSTWIAVAAPYAQSPLDHRELSVMPLAQLRDTANRAVPGSVAHISGGDTAMIWLTHSEDTNRLVKTFADDAITLGIQDIYYGARLALTLNTPAADSRMPDIILQPRAGVSWVSLSEHALMFYGGMQDEDTHVALMISGPQLTGRTDPTYVPTTQLAPLLLRALGMEKFDLRALHLEHSPALPGIF
ncbi:MAG TPA: alkaline phosphatase family protein [Acidobacteriaceae bacterium]|jgi:hypothetical protein|nr:alkaline phosphatase family protein [Acidobacteriaceae bacterium]